MGYEKAKLKSTHPNPHPYKHVSTWWDDLPIVTRRRVLKSLNVDDRFAYSDFYELDMSIRVAIDKYHHASPAYASTPSPIGSNYFATEQKENTFHIILRNPKGYVRFFKKPHIDNGVVNSNITRVMGVTSDGRIALHSMIFSNAYTQEQALDYYKSWRKKHPFL